MSIFQRRFATLLIALLYIHASNALEIEKPAEPPLKELVYWYRNFDSNASHTMLQLALDQTKDLFGELVIKRSTEVTQGRAMIDLEQGDPSSLQIINVVVDPEREKKFIPVRIAADEGLIGLRVCIIHQENLNLFKGARSHKDIMERGITFGQGAHWPDTEILRANSFNVITSVGFENLFLMLKHKRFHCFLRGASEAIDDLKRYGTEELIIEPNLLFSYPSATVFFVHKSNPELAARIELGLRRSILNGTYLQSFHKLYQDDITALDFSKRRIIRLNNPLISNEMLKKISENLIFSDGKLNIF